MERSPPAHSRIHDHYAGLIRQGLIDTGQQLPTEAEIARTFRVSRATVQFAMSRLAWEGWIERYPGRGTFASVRRPRPGVDADMPSIRPLEGGAAGNDGEVTYRLMSFGRKLASADVSRQLGIEQGESILVLERLRFVGTKAVEAESCFFSPDVLPRFNTAALDKIATEKLLIEDNLGFRIDRVETTIQALDGDADEAKALNAEGGKSLIMLSQKYLSDRNKPIVYSDRVCVSPVGFCHAAQDGG